MIPGPNISRSRPGRPLNARSGNNACAQVESNGETDSISGNLTHTGLGGDSQPLTTPKSYSSSTVGHCNLQEDNDFDSEHQSQSSQRQRRVKWTSENDADLLHVLNLSEPSKLGYVKRLKNLWDLKFPERTTSKEALAKRARHLRAQLNKKEGLGSAENVTTQQSNTARGTNIRDVRARHDTSQGKHLEASRGEASSTLVISHTDCDSRQMESGGFTDYSDEPGTCLGEVANTCNPANDGTESICPGEPAITRNIADKETEQIPMSNTVSNGEAPVCNSAIGGTHLTQREKLGSCISQVLPLNSKVSKTHNIAETSVRSVHENNDTDDPVITQPDPEQIDQHLRRQYLTIVRSSHHLEHRSAGSKIFWLSEGQLRIASQLFEEEWLAGEKNDRRLNALVYGLTKIFRQKPKGSQSQKEKDLKFEAKGKKFRRLLAWLDMELRRQAPPTRRQAQIRKELLKQFGSLSKSKITEAREKTYFKLKIWSKKARLIAKSRKSRWMNENYARTQAIPKSRTKIGTLPSKQDLEEFWGGLLETPGKSSSDPGVEAWYNNLTGNTQPGSSGYIRVTDETWQKVLNKVKPFKATGPDCIYGFFVKKIPGVAAALKMRVEHWINSGGPPAWLIAGRTTLVPKTKSSAPHASDFRPITCLNTFYKLYTSTVAFMIGDHLLKEPLIPLEQRACRSGLNGTMDCLIVDQLVTNWAKLKRKRLSVAWFDYRKAYDSVNHAHLIKVLGAMGLPITLKESVTCLLAKWVTTFQVNDGANSVQTRSITLKRGIFQGDSLSVLLFVISIIPVSWCLNHECSKLTMPELPKFTNHLLYMDDLKVYAPSRKALEDTLKVVVRVSTSIGMELGIDKCAQAHIVNGKLVKEDQEETPTDLGIKTLSAGECYKYLGKMQLFGHGDSDETAKEVENVFLSKAREILKLGMNSRNTTAAWNSGIVSGLRYFLSSLTWSRSYVDRTLERSFRKVLSSQGYHYRVDSIERLHMQRKDGGRGVKSLLAEYDASVLSLAGYFSTTTDDFLQGSWQLMRWMSEEKNRKTLFSEARKICEARGLEVTIGDVITCEGHKIEPQNRRKLCKILKLSYSRNLTAHLRSKKNFGKFYSTAADIGNHNFEWIKDGLLAPTTEALAFAIQNRCVKLNYYKAHVLKTHPNDRCRVCHRSPETVTHVINGCEAYNFTKYLDRHDECMTCLYKGIADLYSLARPEYRARPPPVVENSNAKILWDVCIPTLATIEARRPDMVVFDKNRKLIVVIDQSCPGVGRLLEAHMEKTEKYEAFRVDLAKMHPGWTVTVVPVIMGSLGVYHKDEMTRILLKNFPEMDRKALKKVLKDMQRAAILGTVRVVKNHLATPNG